jgi:hypothetical protein
MKNLIKISPLEDESFHADGQMDMMKLIVAFCNFSNALKQEIICINIFVGEISDLQTLLRVQIFMPV